MKRIIALAAILATSAIAEPVPLSLQATGYTELIVPSAVSYQPAVAESVVTEADGSTTTNAAIAEAIIIECDYQLRAGVTVIDTTLSGIRTEIAPRSNPTFSMKITLPVAAFESYFGEGASGVVAALQAAGSIQPNAALTELIRNVAAQVIAAQ